MTIGDDCQRAQANDHTVHLVGAPRRLVGVVTRSDLDRLDATDKAGEPIVTITQKSLVHVRHSARHATRLPVIVAGVVSGDDLLSTCRCSISPSSVGYRRRLLTCRY
jgi:hypothetical protein